MKQVSSFYINIGKVIGVHGIKGNFKVYAYTNAPDDIALYKHVLLSSVDMECIDKSQVDIVKPDFESLTYQGGTKKAANPVQVKYVEIEDRTMAEEKVGSFLYVDGANFKQLKDDYYWFQLVGADVYNNDGFYFGKVLRFFDNGANDVVVTGKEVLDDDLNKHVKEYFLPYHSDFIVEVVGEEGKMIIDWPEEL